MAEHASKYLIYLSKSVSSLAPSSFSFLQFSSKTELLSYLILCVSKMPFPPVSITRSVSGLTGKEKPISGTSSSSALSVPKSRVLREDKGSSVKDRLALNLKQLGKKSPPRSHLPTAKGVSGMDLHAKRKERLLPSSQTLSDGLPASSSGESLCKTAMHKHTNHTLLKSEPEVRSRSRTQEEARFTLTLTPEAALLLQRRNSERRSAARNSGNGAGVCGNTTESRRRRENLSKRHPPAVQRQGTTNGSRAAAKSHCDVGLGDISSFVKISLLNERHKYDDVEYEDEEDHGVDERVVLKCTEWLRGLENTPVTVGNSLSKSTSGVKSF
ncbi:uncharacterized protein ACBR49_001339 [Aulostomus maculatus]